MNRALLAIVTAYLFSIPAHAQSVHVAGWEVKPFAEGSAASGCSMAADYQDGTRVGIVMFNDHSWGLTLYNASWGLKTGTKVRVDAYVDNRLLTSDSAAVIAPNLALLELQGASAYRALMAGQKLELYTNLGEVRFRLTGTAKAMSAVLGCVGRMNGDSTTAATQSPNSEDAYAVSRADATVLVTNMLNAASVRDYKLLPPKNNENGVVYFTMADGSLGAFFAFRGKDTPSADTAIGSWISRASTDCKGEYLSGKQSLPSTDGSVIRKAVGTCREGGTAIITETTVIRRESGFLLTLTQSRPEQANLETSSTGAPSNGGSGLIDAALTVDEPR